ncbi:MAG TPA: hypothetical protein VEW03_04000 [Longimicrobiaceae bacterium]|nr:hypothetical protein [Longimicrobiaceae bacterium]
MGLVLRIAVITAGLVAAGVVAGGVVGAAMMWFWLLLGGIRFLVIDPIPLLVGAVVGGMVGGVLGPVAVWLLMRHVPLGQAIGVTSLGTLAGAIFGLVAGGPVASLALSFVGFGVAAVALRVRTPRRRRELPRYRGAPALRPD